MRAILLSAGFGKRLRPFTEKAAKPAIPFLGVPMIGYPVFLAEKAGVKRAVINTHHLPDTVMTAAKSLRSNIDFEFLHEAPEILDSGGGIKNAESFLSEDEAFWVFNGDTILLLKELNVFKAAWEQHLKTNAIATVFVTTFPRDQKGLGGVFTKPASNKIECFSRTPLNEGFDCHHYVGVAIYSKEIFKYLPANKASNIFYDGVTAAIEDGCDANIFALHPALWLETGNPQDYEKASRSCLQELREHDKSSFGSHLRQVLTRNPNTGWDGNVSSESELDTLAQRFALK